jgi:hypothetical protein
VNKPTDQTGEREVGSALVLVRKRSAVILKERSD